MDDSFDGYRKWLGIPPEEQPPHHYRLLGIAVFEDDPDVIENAANRQMTHVRTFQSGRYSKLSQKILNELSTAKICLLNDEKKQAYDTRLKANAPTADKQSSAPPKAPPPKPTPPQAPPLHSGSSPADAPPMQAAPPMGTHVPQATPVATVAPIGASVSPQRPPSVRTGSTSPFTAPKTPAVSKRARARRKSSIWPLVLGFVSVAALLGVVVVVANRDTQETVAPEIDAGTPVLSQTNGTPPGATRNATNTVPDRRPPNKSSNDDSADDNPFMQVDDGFRAAPPVSRSNDEPRRGPARADDTFEELMEAAIRETRARDIESARKRLERVSYGALNTQQQAKFQHVKQLMFRMEDVVVAARRGLTNLKRWSESEGDEPFELEGRNFRVIDFKRGRAVYMLNDRRMEYMVSEIPTVHLIVFAKFGVEPEVFDSPEMQAKVATYLTSDHLATPSEQQWARKLAEGISGDPELAWVFETFGDGPLAPGAFEPPAFEPEMVHRQDDGPQRKKPPVRPGDDRNTPPVNDPNDPFGVNKPGENPFRDDDSPNNPFRNDDSGENPFN